MQAFNWRGIIEQVSALNLRMHSCAEQELWQEFVSLSEQRDQLLRQLDSPALDNLAEAESVALSAEIASLQRQNQKLLAICKARQSDIRQAHQKSRISRRAIQAYHRS